MKFGGIEWAPLRIPLERRLQTLAIVYYSFIPFQGFAFLILFFYLAFYTDYYYITIAYLLWMLIDRKTCQRGGRRIDWVRRWTFWRWVKNYFPVRMVKTYDLDPNRNYICGIHPHGILVVGGVISFATEALDFSRLYPGITPHLTSLQMQFLLPMQRELAMALGVSSVSKDSINWLLNNEGKGQLIGIVIGGVREIVDAHPGSARLTLNNRKGFVRLALQNGASLVPTFSFGESELYYQLPNPEGSSIRKIQDILMNSLGFSIPILNGRGIFQYTFGILPHRKPIDVIVGKPIYVQKIEEPSEKEVDQLHRKYLEELKALYDKYKTNYNAYQHVNLEFV